MRGELPSQEQTTCSGNSRCSSVCRLARIEWNNRGQPETPARRKSRVISVRRFEFFLPIVVLAAARYWGGLRGPRYRRSLLGKDWAATNATTFVMLDLWLRDANPIHFPIDVLPA